MQEIREKILQTRTFQKKVVQTVLSFLARGLRICRRLDPLVQAEFDAMPEDFVLVLGVLGARHPIILQNRSTGLYRVRESFAAVCNRIPLAPPSVARHFSVGTTDPSRMLEIRFKSVEAGWRMITGQISIAQAYARHDLMIHGEIARAMQFVRCIERVEAYLLPKRMARRLRLLQEQLPNPRWRIWLQLLYAKKEEYTLQDGKEVL